jgi:N-acetylglucosamine kinase-like BadF-type ATPase
MNKTNTTDRRIARLARRIAKLAAAERARYGAHVAERLVKMAAAEVERMRRAA